MSPSPMIRLPQFLLACSALLLAFPAFGQSKPDCSSLPDHTKLRSVLQSVVKEGADRQQWPWQSRVGSHRKPRWHRLCRCFQWQRSRSAVARQSCYRCREGQHGKRPQFIGLRSLHGQCLRRFPARTESIQPGHQRTSKCAGCIRSRHNLWHPRRPHGRKADRRCNRFRWRFAFV